MLDNFDNLISAMTLVSKLTQEKRYKSVPEYNETVSDHLMMGLQILAYTHDRLPDHVDKFKIFKQYMIHDNAESITGDIEYKSKEQKENEVEIFISMFDNFADLKADAIDYENRMSDESHIVKSLDLLQATIMIYISEGKVFQRMKRTRQDEDRLFPISLHVNIYAIYTFHLRNIMEEKGWFYKGDSTPCTKGNLYF